jgi:thioredoxin-dependent peroxiredoxin
MLGKPVPDFSLPSTGNSSPFTLSSARGRDNTKFKTWIGERRKGFTRARCEIYGVSRDSIKSHESFKAKMKFPFELLSDPEETVCEQFGVMKLKNMYGKKVRGIERSTFVVDEDGVLAREWRGVKVPGHVQEVLSFVKAL